MGRGCVAEVAAGWFGWVAPSESFACRCSGSLLLGCGDGGRGDGPRRVIKRVRRWQRWRCALWPALTDWSIIWPIIWRAPARIHTTVLGRWSVHAVDGVRECKVSAKMVAAEEVRGRAGEIATPLGW